jgi:hypothetical protein
MQEFLGLYAYYWRFIAGFEGQRKATEHIYKRKEDFLVVSRSRGHLPVPEESTVYGTRTKMR